MTCPFSISHTRIAGPFASLFCCFCASVLLLVSGEQLDNVSGSVRPLLDTFVLWRLSRLFNQGQSLLHRGFSGSPAQPLQVLQ